MEPADLCAEPCRDEIRDRMSLTRSASPSADKGDPVSARAEPELRQTGPGTRAGAAGCRQ